MIDIKISGGLVHQHVAGLKAVDHFYPTVVPFRTDRDRLAAQSRFARRDQPDVSVVILPVYGLSWGIERQGRHRCALSIAA